MDTKQTYIDRIEKPEEEFEDDWCQYCDGGEWYCTCGKGETY